jgi:hypothetical protein
VKCPAPDVIDSPALDTPRDHLVTARRRYLSGNAKLRSEYRIQAFHR